MGMLYLSLMGDSSIKNKLATSQKHWLDERNKCNNAACISKAYDNRITQLQRYQITPTAITSLPLKGEWKANYSNQYATASLNITKLENTFFDYHLVVKNGANMGEIKGRAQFMGDDALSIDSSEVGNSASISCLILFQPKNNHLIVHMNEGCRPFMGNGVTFDGTYVKDGSIYKLTLKDQGLLDTDEQEQEFEKLTTSDYNLFRNNCGGATSTHGISDAPKASVRTAFMPGLANTSACIVMTNKNQIWAAVTDEKNHQVKYFTNDSSYQKILPLAIMQWIKELETSQGHKIEVVYGK